MSTNDRTTTQKSPVPRAQRRPDKRAHRTRQRLGIALVELMQEKSIDEVSVQEVLDRAAVGRSTFYLHFNDKNDLLLSQLEMFLNTMSSMLILNNEKSHRVMPVAEMFDHIRSANKLYRALGDAGRLNDFFDLAQTYFARGIRQRLADSKRLPHIPRRELAARAAALAGCLISLLQWWISHEAKDSPQAMDNLFHKMVWTGLQ
jgi:AcrR family transcriptional regulator